MDVVVAVAVVVFVVVLAVAVINAVMAFLRLWLLWRW